VRASVAGGIASIILVLTLLVIGILSFVEIFNKVNRNLQIRTRELNAYKYNMSNNFLSSDLVECTNALGCIDITTEDIV
jgi:hypothetical protein